MLERANLFIIGAGKSGTTNLWSLLDQHPQTAMSTIKEPSFFSQDAAFEKGLDWYHTLYHPSAETRVMGEASNSYSATGHWPHTPARIAEYYPDAKLIYIVRSPVKRTESDWMEYTRQHDVSFAEFITSNDLCHDKNDYPRQYAAYREHFDADQILVLLFEDLIADQAAVLARIANFLSIDPNFQLASEGHQRASAQQGKHRAFALKIRRSVLYRTLSRFIPNAIRRKAGALATTQREIERPEWSDAERREFTERYETQSRAFLSQHGYDPGRWEF